MKKKRYNQAFELFDKVRQSEDPDLDVGVLFTMGVAYYDHSKYAEALDCFDKGTSIRPTCIGMMLPYLNYLSSVLPYVEQMIQQRPDFVEALYLKARILSDSYQHAEALTVVNSALEKEPNHKESLELRNALEKIVDNQ